MEAEMAERSSGVTRRDLLRLSMGGGAGLALSGLVDWPAAAAAARALKLADVQEFTTSCSFCACGCGMVASVRDGKLIAMEGDFDHIVNRGSLCVKGLSMFATHASPNRLTTPRYRAPGSDHWEDISWDDAIARVAQKIRATRDTTWIATEKVGDKEVPVNRTTPSASWAARRTRTRSVISFRKRRGCSDWPTSNTRPDFEKAPPSPVWGRHSAEER
jgi:formate dehydrogenase major subunit